MQPSSRYVRAPGSESPDGQGFRGNAIVSIVLGKSVFMRIPILRGLIDRRILVNFRVDADLIARRLPAPFRPKLVDGYAMGGICLIRLKAIRPRFLPIPLGIGSENAAHRIAVEWDVNGKTMEGVYIPRRDTSSRLNTLVGGTIFPGVHHHARFVTEETGTFYAVAFNSDDGVARVRLSGTVANDLPSSSVFRSVAMASEFFKTGSLGYSATQIDGRYDGLELRCKNWQVRPLDIHAIESSYFDNELDFPAGSVTFDCALLMRGIDHEWHALDDLEAQATFKLRGMPHEHVYPPAIAPQMMNGSAPVKTASGTNVSGGSCDTSFEQAK